MAQGDKRWVRFEPTIGWGSIVATLALILSVFSIYVNWTASSPSIRVMELRTNWGPIEDPNTQSIRYIALHPVAVSNTGGGTASLIGITGESAIPLVTGQSGEKPGSLREVPHEVFLSEYLADEIRANPVKTYSITFGQSAPMLWDDFDVGDVLNFYIKNGEFKESGTARVVEASVEVTSEGSERVKSLVIQPE